MWPRARSRWKTCFDTAWLLRRASAPRRPWHRTARRDYLFRASRATFNSPFSHGCRTPTLEMALPPHAWAQFLWVTTTTVPRPSCGTRQEKRGTPFLRRRSLPILSARRTIMLLLPVSFLRMYHFSARTARRRSRGAFLFWARAAGTGSSGLIPPS